MDVIKELGTRAFGTRLKRLVEYSTAKVMLVYSEFNLDFEPTWLPFFVAIQKSEDASIQQIADLTGVSHSAVSQIMNSMKAKGLVDVQNSSKDRRQKVIRITDKGTESLQRLEPVCDAIKLELDERFEKTGYDVLDVIERIEHEIRQGSLSESIIKRVWDNESKKLEYYLNDERYLEAARELCYQCVRDGLYAEESLFDIFSSPQKLESRGIKILMSVKDSTITGVCIFQKHGVDAYDLELFTVIKEMRWQGYGSTLLEMAIAYIRKDGVSSIYAETEGRFALVLNILINMGFKVVEPVDGFKHRENNIKLKLTL